MDVSVEDGLNARPITSIQKKTDPTKTEQRVSETSDSAESDILFPTIHTLDSYELKSSYGLPVKPFPHRDTTTAEANEYKLLRHETPGNMLQNDTGTLRVLIIVPRSFWFFSALAV